MREGRGVREGRRGIEGEQQSKRGREVFTAKRMREGGGYIIQGTRWRRGFVAGYGNDCSLLFVYSSLYSGN